jgi:hypothetical protein
MIQPLGGEVDSNRWYFARHGEEGPLPNPSGHTFPLLTHDEAGKWSLVGTGFYVSDNGLFVTAGHVIEHVCRDGKQVFPLVILHLHSDVGLFGASECLFRPIMQCWLGATEDVAFGVAATATNNKTGQELRNWTWTLSWKTLPNGAPVGTYAFPNHILSDDGTRISFRPDAYVGTVQASGDFRDKVVMPFPYLQVDFRIHGAASGGPIFNDDGRVVGVNCTEWPDNIDHPVGPGFGAQIRCLKDAFIDDVVPLEGGCPRRMTFDELVRSGSISVADYLPRDADAPLSGSVLRLDMPTAAKPPEIEVTQYA